MAAETQRDHELTCSSNENEEERARVDIYKYIFGFVEMAVVKCAIELGIADTIESHGRPISLLELSSALSCAPPALHRIMRFLVNRKIFKEFRNDNVQDSQPCLYAQTALSQLLLRSSEKSMATFMLMESSPPMLAPWHGLSARVKTEVDSWAPSPFEVANGKDLWSYAAANPGHSRLINEGLACNARVTVAAILDGCPDVFNGIGTIVDVGGGNGTALRMLIRACPWIRGINFDLPHVVSVALQSDGVEHVGGDMFKSVPKADAAFIMSVLHDWEDDECIQILKKCREAIPEVKGKVIMVECVTENNVKEKHKGEELELELKDVGLFLDMVMLAHTNKGKERTSEEWAYVLGQAGLTRFNIRTINAMYSVIEAFPS
ncbi:acetylserotonin O-methyltransferase-like [Humulus lupulus]|uniref:acetylserotonin O-methyltransferase-like n=1 Tax=Humulus lupulus TaxID=3486 RepID=UPI002B401E76|nr:acetylserotonin O-methyltransferase-like [Humulus lupulus]